MQTQKELFDVIDTNNRDHAAWEKKFDFRLGKQHKKYAKRWLSQAESFQKIQTLLQRVISHRLAVHGTQKFDGSYADKTDADGRAGLFLLKKFWFVSQDTEPTYFKHADVDAMMEKDVKDLEKNFVFLDVGNAQWFDIKAKTPKSLFNAQMRLDHHPVWPSSTAYMVHTILDKLRMIPADQKVASKKFVKTLDIVDSYLSTWWRVSGEAYPRSLVGLSYYLDEESLYALCQHPDVWNPLDPLPDSLLPMEVKKQKLSNGTQETVLLSDIVAAKTKKMQTAYEKIDGLIRQERTIRIDDKKFVVLNTLDANDDAWWVAAAQRGYGTFKIHRNGGVFVVHEQWIPKSFKGKWKIIRDVLFMLNPRDTDHDYDKNIQSIIKKMHASESCMREVMKSFKIGWKKDAQRKEKEATAEVA